MVPVAQPAVLSLGNVSLPLRYKDPLSSKQAGVAHGEGMKYITELTLCLLLSARKVGR